MTAVAGDEAETLVEPPPADPMPADPTSAGPFVWTPPVPVLAPYLGLVSAIGCALGGGWLLLAPYALDYRQGAPKTPRTTEIDLATGAAVVAIAIVSAVLFAVNLARRLRVPGDPAIEPEPIPDAALADPETSDFFAAPDAVEAEPELQPEPAPEPEPKPETVQIPQPAPAPDPNSSLRDLLTPLVAALAADLKSRSDNPESGARP